jgi:hypothetical protein
MRISRIAQIAAGVALTGALTACGGQDEPTHTVNPPPVTASPTPSESPSDVLASTAWETTGAKDATGKDVPLTSEQVKAFVGYAYFTTDGTFTMFNLDDSPKMQGDWSISPDGKKRTVIAKDASGKELFRRDVDIVTLTDKEFTYRVYPNEDDKKVYFDIIHTPTDHAEPVASATPSAGSSQTPTPSPSPTSSTSLMSPTP